jgi:hypothetical protein
MTKKDVKDSLGARGMSAKLFEVLKEPEIRQTSPPGAREDHEKYSAEVSAAIRTS